MFFVCFPFLCRVVRWLQALCSLHPLSTCISTLYLNSPRAEQDVLERLLHSMFLSLFPLGVLFLLACPFLGRPVGYRQSASLHDPPLINSRPTSRSGSGRVTRWIRIHKPRHGVRSAPPRLDGSAGCAGCFRELVAGNR